MSEDIISVPVESERDNQFVNSQQALSAMPNETINMRNQMELKSKALDIFK